jgi:hypothetical protein
MQEQPCVNDGKFTFPTSEGVLEEGGGEDICRDKRGLEEVLVSKDGVGGGEKGGDKIAAIEVLRWDSGVG